MTLSNSLRRALRNIGYDVARDITSHSVDVLDNDTYARLITVNLRSSRETFIPAPFVTKCINEDKEGIRNFSLISYLPVDYNTYAPSLKGGDSLIANLLNRDYLTQIRCGDRRYLGCRWLIADITHNNLKPIFVAGVTSNIFEDFSHKKTIIVSPDIFELSNPAERTIVKKVIPYVTREGYVDVKVSHCIDTVLRIHNRNRRVDSFQLWRAINLDLGNTEET